MRFAFALLILSSFINEKFPIQFKETTCEFGTVNSSDSIKCRYYAKNVSSKEVTILGLDSNYNNVCILVKSISENSFHEPRKTLNGYPVILPSDSILVIASFLSNETGPVQRTFNLDLGYDKLIFTMSGNIINDAPSKPCKNRLKREVDEITNEIKIKSPYSMNAVILKYIKEGNSTYYLSLNAKGYTVSVGEKGVTILFTDGSKFVKPNAEIDVEAENGYYNYSAFLRLNKSEIKLFEDKIIKKFRLYIYDSELELNDAEVFKSYVSCIILEK